MEVVQTVRQALVLARKLAPSSVLTEQQLRLALVAHLGVGAVRLVELADGRPTLRDCSAVLGARTRRRPAGGSIPPPAVGARTG